MREQRGSGSILLLGVVAAILIAVATAAGGFGLLVAHQRVQGAADAAALAAADVASGAVPGAVCDAAARAAGLNDATVTSCSADGQIVTVEVAADWLGVGMTARARAGPPP